MNWKILSALGFVTTLVAGSVILSHYAIVEHDLNLVQVDHIIHVGEAVEEIEDIEIECCKCN